MNLTWLTEIEKHVSFGFIVTVCIFFLKKHKLVILGVQRLNLLWRDRCGLTREPYTPVENGSPEIVPEMPAWYKK